VSFSDGVVRVDRHRRHDPDPDTEPLDSDCRIGSPVTHHIHSGKRSTSALRPLLAALMLSLLAYGGSLWATRIFDDSHSVFQNPALREGASILRLFEDVGAFSVYSHAANNYRPVTLTSYAVTFRLFGESDIAFHAGNLLIHVACVAALYALLLALLPALNEKGPAEVPAAVGAAVFGIHPAASQVVHYISSRSESLALAGILGALALHAYSARATSGRQRLLLRGLQFLSVAFALGSKESGVIVLPLLVALDLALEPRPLAGIGRRIGRLAAPTVLVAIYFVLQLLPGLGRFLSESAATGGAASARPDWTVDSLSALWVYLGIFAFPAKLAFWRELPPEASAAFPATLAALLLVGSIGLATVLLLLGRMRAMALAILFFFFPFAPYLLRPLYLVVNENRLYPSLLGLAIAAALFYARFYRSWLNSGGTRRIVALSIGLALMAGAIARDWSASYVWASEIRAWRNAVAVSPHSGVIRAGIGTALMREQRWSEATEQFMESLLMNPDQSAVIHDNIGICAYQQGDVETAHRHFLYAHALDPNSIEILNNLGSVLHELGRPEDALPYLDRAAELSPGYCEPRIEALMVARTMDDAASLRDRLLSLPPHCLTDPRIPELRRWLENTTVDN
jgi:tetratricopeptide (TPR) repeat protein